MALCDLRLVQFVRGHCSGESRRKIEGRALQMPSCAVANRLQLALSACALLWDPETLAGRDPETLAGSDPPADLRGLR